MFNKNQHLMQANMSTALNPRTPRLLLAVIILAICGVFIHGLYGYSGVDLVSVHAFGSDDAYISYRYAKNLFDGYGLVFNPNEYVEGYSNFLYTLLLTPAFWLPQLPIYIYSLTLNAILLALAIAIFHHKLKKQFSEQQSIVGSTLLAANPFIWANAATGLETMLVLVTTLLIWVSVDTYIKTGKRLDFFYWLFFVAISILVRIDGFLLPLIGIIYLFIKEKHKSAIVSLIFVSTLMVIYTIWRLYYYQDIIGNTYYAKVSGDILDRVSSGFYFLKENAFRGGLWLYFLAVVFSISNIIKSPLIRLQNINFPLLYSSLFLLYLVYIGGDIYYERFLISFFPFGIYLLLLHIPSNFKKPYIYIIFACILFIQSIPVIKDHRFNYQSKKYDAWIELGLFLKQYFPNTTLATGAAGKIPYYSELRTIDILGLNDKHIGKLKNSLIPFHVGHNKYDPQYVFSLKPDLIATWIDPNLDMRQGMYKKLYQREYQLKFLVNTTRVSQKSNIIDVSTADETTINSLISNGYNYGVLLRLKE
ncbi:glycosyltransferase family 39 protein [Sulfurirhabdus autotrophica]|uniref:Dolichyl-phosphate-mannose-protein mannosyltransferase n=1 Tax=Sulfurirhabdus autotrophica TaxID=1706046 RepID=A0A4R3XU96_9PROT|nr:glycosyltransferase family 39 protein [Sulfurirhabdus autotrophica]TCV82512.1 dolichyl-phosphate-mannose-protein mannosyltransferase [Sulfurirhabdus autotrophica]